MVKFNKLHSWRRTDCEQATDERCHKARKPKSLFTLTCILYWHSVYSCMSDTTANDIQVIVEPATVKPGEPFVISIVTAARYRVHQLRASIRGYRPKFFQYGNTWRALAAVSSKTPAGRYPLYIKALVARDTEVHHWGTVTYVTVLYRRFPMKRIRVSTRKFRYTRRQATLYDRKRLNAAMATTVAKPLWDGNFILPVRGKISTTFGVRRTVNGRPWNPHAGIDIAAPAGTPVAAANHGKVVLAEMLRTHGGTVVIDHGCNVFTIYIHLSAIYVSLGQEVRKGDAIGAVGSTGLATGPHLHWTVRIGSIATDPLAWVRQAPQLSSDSPKLA